MPRALSALSLVTVAAGCSSMSAATSDLGGADMASARNQAVLATLGSRSECTSLSDFYWEIGDVNGSILSGTVGTGVAADTRLSIASASKFVWGAYVVERFQGNLSSVSFPAMSMQSGYNNLTYDACIGTATVTDCFNAGSNSTYNASALNHFYYNGGHFQKYAIDLGLGADNNAELQAEIQKYVGTEIDIAYGSPQLAGGIQTSASAYAVFLRKILAGRLALHDQLGANAVCTLPSACPTAQYSPAPYAWHYSYAHWVEDEPNTGDGAFSSAGAFGFYPWIDASKTYYGILARYSLAPQAYIQSAECGRLLRKAFITGMQQ